VEVKEVNERTAVISFQGAIDTSNTPEIGEGLKSLISQGKSNIVIDLSGVSYIGSWGLGVTISVYKAARENKGTLKLTQVPPEIMDVFNLTGLDKIFEIYDSVNDALASCKPE
jgi:anti-sigma B factor antagonist